MPAKSNTSSQNQSTKSQTQKANQIQPEVWITTLNIRSYRMPRKILRSQTTRTKRFYKHPPTLPATVRNYYRKASYDRQDNHLEVTVIEIHSNCENLCF